MAIPLATTQQKFAALLVSSDKKNSGSILRNACVACET